MVLRSLTTLALVALTFAANAAECTARSGANTAALVELYTSEGCNSCPPADDWLRGLPRAGFGPDRVVPLSLHVDYWDYIGWKDPYANRGFTARQREIAAITKARVVYTPQVVLAGRDYRGWSSRRDFADAVKTVNSTPAQADIALTLSGGAFRAKANVAETGARADAAFYIAAYENGLSNRVTAGENRGVTLHHDFVVRQWWGPIAFDAAGTAELARPIEANAAKGGLAAFVQNRRNGDVLQALALPACN
jgi:hypothetical protein